MHRFCEPLGLALTSERDTDGEMHATNLFRDLFLLVPGECGEGVELRPYQKRYCGLHFLVSWCRNGRREACVPC